MYGRRDAYPDYQDMREYACDYNSYDNMLTKSSSGTSASSSARPTQRYPQTTSARRKADVANKLIRGGYMATEPCLGAAQSGPTAGQLSAKYRSTQSYGRPQKNVARPKTPSPGACPIRRPQGNDSGKTSNRTCGEDVPSKYQSPGSPYSGAACPIRRPQGNDSGKASNRTCGEDVPSQFQSPGSPCSGAVCPIRRPQGNDSGKASNRTCGEDVPVSACPIRRPQGDDSGKASNRTCGEDAPSQSPSPTTPHRGAASSTKRQAPCGQQGKPVTPGTPGQCPLPKKAPKSACAQPYKQETPVSKTFAPESLAGLFGKNCPNMDPEQRAHCSFQEYDEERDDGFIAKIIKKIRGQPNPCPLKVDFSQRKTRSRSALVRKKSSCFSKRENENQSLEQLDDLWNPDTFMRWKCVDNWDQHKESLWRSVIQAKVDCPESHNRNIEDMMYDAFKAMNAPGGECISFRMIYGILRRNEDMYLNPYIDHFTDEQFLKLIVALNRFFTEDRDKRKMFFDHPPPTFIEKIMMKETLGVIDPTCPVPTIARRFWELLLDWYAKKINAESGDDNDC